MEGFEAYKLYVAVKNHFNQDSYDITKYKGKVNCKRQTFEKRPDKRMFMVLSKKYSKKELLRYYVANFLLNSSNWIGDLLQEDAYDNYIKRARIVESLHENFKNDMDRAFDEVSSLKDLLNKDDGYPPILTMLFQGKIEYETFLVLDKLFNLITRYDKKFSYDPVWKSWSKKLTKYKVLVNINRDVYRESLLTIISDKEIVE